MNCAELETLLCDYVDNALPSGQKAEVESHLAACTACAELAQDAAAAVAFMERAAPVEPPPELITRILFSLPAAKHARTEPVGSVGRFLTRLLQPMLQPRFAMGFAMTILSFSMLGKFAGISPRQLTRDDLNPVKIWTALDDRLHRAWDRSVKFYESLRLMYEIQTRLGEWTETDTQKSQPASVDEQAAGRTEQQQSVGTSGGTSRK